MLSYQHAYHAGNFADVQKHVLLCHILSHYGSMAKRVTYMDTHSGRGLYDLNSAEAEKTGEWRQGIHKLKDSTPDSPLIQRYLTAVQPYLEQGQYPGSPKLICDAMAANHHGVFFDYHPAEFEHLKATLAEDPRARVHHSDAAQDALAHLPNRKSEGLILIDPSYEVKSDYEDTARLANNLRKRWPQATILVWYPLLPEQRHEQLKAKLPTATLFELLGPKKDRGMYASGMACLLPQNTPLDLTPFTAAQQELQSLLF